MKALKAIPIVLIVIAVIGFKVYNSTPHWRVLEEEAQTIPVGQAFSYEIEVYRPAKVRVTCSSGADMAIYRVDAQTHKAIQTGGQFNMSDIAYLSESTTDMSPKTISLDKGHHYFYFEPITDTDAVTFNYKIEAYD